jgi:hypothetical protein
MYRQCPPVFRIRIHRIRKFLGLADPDPLVRGTKYYESGIGSFLGSQINADPDPGSQTNSDPDSGQALKSQKVEFLHEKYSESR